MAIERNIGRSWLPLGWLAVALFVPAVAAGNPAAPESLPAPALRARATALFRAKKFAAACPMFEAAARRLPDELEISEDLALCQHRLGSDELALQTNLEVIGRASQPERLDEPRFARVRRHAYFNLAELEPDLESSVSYDESCYQLQAAPGCNKTLSACGISRVAGGRFYNSSASVIRLAQTEEGARMGDDPADDSPDFQSLVTPSPELPVSVAADGTLDYLTSFSEEQFTYPCDWACQSSSAVSDEVTKCQSNTKLAPAAREDCERTVCERAERAPWAAVKAELRDADACYQDAVKVDGEYGCRVVYANACSGLVGLICSGHAGGEHETRTRVEEYRFQAATEGPTR